MKEYTPKLIENTDYALMLVETTGICQKCGKRMINSPPEKHYRHYVFPHYVMQDFEAQIKRAGWVKKSQIRVDDKCICVECAEKGLADFLCALCNERKSSDKKKEYYGDPVEFLCIDCYESVPAKVWDDKNKELQERHRWDFE